MNMRLDRTAPPRRRGRPSGRRRRAGWLLVPPRAPWPVRVALGVLGVAWLAFVVSTFLRSETQPLWDAWVYDGLMGGSALVVLARAVLVRSERAAWTVIGLGLALNACGDIVWSLLSALGRDDFPGPADALYLLLYPCLYAGIGLLLRGRLRRFPMSSWLDGIVAACALTAMVAALAFGRIAASTDGDGWVIAVALAYPVGDLTLLACVAGAQSLLGWRTDARWWSLTAGFTLYAVADVIFLLISATGTYEDGEWSDALWPAAMILIAITSWRPARQLTHEGLQGWAALAPSAVGTLGAIGVLCVAAGPRVPTLAVVLAALTLLAAAARFMTSYREIAALAESRHQALSDELTGLANRRALMRALEASRGHPSLALLLIDLDRFKEINDSLGHHVGDELLVQVARRLRTAARPQDLVVRLGGDEFAVLMTAEGSPGLAAAQQSADRVVAALATPFALDDVTLHVHGSVGIGVLPDHTDDPVRLLQRADVAMYAAKSAARAGAARVGVYEPESDPHSRERLHLLEELRSSLRDGGIVCHYQPKVELRTGRVRAVEVLARWQHPVRGLVPPDGFLPLAEHAGLMRELTASVLGTALDQARRWRAAGRDLTVAVNLSPTNLLDVDLPAQVSEALRAHGLPASVLELEITETVMMTNADRCRQVIAELRALGVHTAIDDYGTGYSSLAYLQDLAVDTLKIDRAFVCRLATDQRAAAIVRSTIELAHSLGLTVVAEGVEDAATAEALLQFGCDFSQGYLHSPALPADALAGWLDRDPPRGPRPATPGPRAERTHAGQPRTERPRTEPTPAGPTLTGPTLTERPLTDRAGAVPSPLM